MITTLSNSFNIWGCHTGKALKHPCYVSGTTLCQLTYGIDQHNLSGYTDTDGASTTPHHAIQAMPSYLMASHQLELQKSKGLLPSPPLKWNYLQQLMQRWKLLAAKKNHS